MCLLFNVSDLIARWARHAALQAHAFRLFFPDRGSAFTDSEPRREGALRTHGRELPPRNIAALNAGLRRRLGLLEATLTRLPRGSPGQVRSQIPSRAREGAMRARGRELPPRNIAALSAG